MKAVLFELPNATMEKMVASAYGKCDCKVAQP